MVASATGMAGLTMRVALVAVLAMRVWAGSALAGPGAGREPMVQIAWSAPAECPGSDEFAALLDEAVIAPPTRPVRVEARIARHQGEYTLSLRVRMAQAAGERSLRAPRCEELVRAAALIVALAIEPSEPRFPPGEDDDERPPRATLAGLEPLPPAPPPRRARGSLGLPFDVTARLMIGGDLGVLPAVAPGVHATVAVAPAGWRLELGGSYLFEQLARTAADPDTGGLISLGSVSVRGCAELLAHARAVAQLCAGGEMGSFHSSGQGNTTSREAAQLHAAVLGGAALALRISEPLSLRVDAHAAMLLVRPRFSVCALGPASDCAVPLETLWQPERVAHRIVAGVEMVFP